MRKQIAGALVASLLIGSAPVWAEEGNTTKAAAEEAAQRQPLRDSIDRAVDRAMGSAAAEATPAVVPVESKLPAPPLTAGERRDLDARSAALQTDPVARGAGGIVLLVLGTALSLGATAYFINKSKNDSSTTPSVSRR
jgi:hypothetical protein